MSYIIKNSTQGAIVARLTDAGRKKLSEGKLNIGLFETVIWDNANDRGFDVNFVNPLIFYTAIEFATSSRAGNALLGASLKYKFKNITLYYQLLLDEINY